MFRLDHLAAWVLLACFTWGCASDRKHSRSDREIKADQQADENHLAWFFSQLSSEQITELNKLRDQMPAPSSIPFQDSGERETYTIWYRTGFAYGLMTGMRVLRDSVWRGDRSGIDRAKMEGWFAGSIAGGGIRQSKDIKSGIDAALNADLEREKAKEQAPSP